MAAYINHPIEDVVMVYTALGVPATGRAGSLVATVYDESNNLFSTPVVSEIGATCMYRCDFTPDAVGSWKVKWVGLAGTDHFGGGDEGCVHVFDVIGIDLDADIAAILADTNEIQGKLPTNYIMGSSDKDDHDGTIDTIASGVTDIKGGGWDAATDTLEKIRDAITAASPQNHAATANTQVTGTLDAGDYTSTATNDGVAYWQTSPVSPAVGGFGLNVYLTFNIGTGRVPVSVLVDGRFVAGALRTIQVWAYDYLLADWVQLSNSSNDFDNGVSDVSRQYPLTTNMVKVSDGEVRIRFTSTSTAVGDDWYADYVSLSSIAVAGAGLTPDAIATAVWNFLQVGMDENTMGYALAHISILQGQVVSGASATTFVIDEGVAADDAYKGMLIRLEDKTDDHYEVRLVKSYTGLTRTVVVDRALGFTPAAGDDYYLMSTGYVEDVRGADGDTLKTISEQIDALPTPGDATEATLLLVKGQTDLLPADPASESVVTGAITASEGAIRGTDSDTLKTISDQIDAIPTAGGAQEATLLLVKGQTDLIPADPATEATLLLVKGQTDLLPADPASEAAVEGAVTAAVASIVGGDGDTLETLSDQIDGITIVDMAKESTLQVVKGKTDNLPADPASEATIVAEIEAHCTGGGGGSGTYRTEAG